MPDPNEFITELRRRLTAKIESDPQVLLERDGGPEFRKAHLILATLLGIEGQVDAEWRIPRVVPVLYMPIAERLSVADPDPFAMASYNLQSGFATLQLDWMLCQHLLPDDIETERGTYLIDVLLVRYRRKMEGRS